MSEQESPATETAQAEKPAALSPPEKPATETPSEAAATADEKPVAAEPAPAPAPEPAPAERPQESRAPSSPVVDADPLLSHPHIEALSDYVREAALGAAASR